MPMTQRDMKLVVNLTKHIVVGVQRMADEIAKDIARYMKEEGQKEDEAIEMNVDDMMNAIGSIVSDGDLVSLTRISLIHKTKDALHELK